MSISTKSMLTKMKPNVKVPQMIEKHSAQNSATPPITPRMNSKNPKALSNLDEPTYEMKNLMEMCLAPKNNKLKPTSKS